MRSLCKLCVFKDKKKMNKKKGEGNGDLCYYNWLICYFNHRDINLRIIMFINM